MRFGNLAVTGALDVEDYEMQKMKFRFLFVLLAAVFFLSQVQATKAAAMMESAPGRALEKITPQNVRAFVDQYVEGEMRAAHAPGMVITVVYQGEVIVSQGYGLADVETRRPMTAQTTLRAGSVSKPVTSAGVLQLVAQGEVALDRPVSAYVDDLPLEDQYGPAGTVAQLLTLKGGYADAVVETHAPTLAEWQPLGQYLEDNLEPRVMPPGKVHSYNSWEHALLGYMMAKVREKPFDQAMAELLFRPLGMEQSSFSQPLPEAIAANLARGYAYEDGKYEEVPLDYVRLSPGVALVTSGEDMGRFMLALLNGGKVDGAQVLAPQTVSGMLHRQEEVHPYSRGRTYGLSEITLEGRQVLYHDGNGIGFGSRMILAPGHGLGIFLSTNHRPLGPDASSTAAYQFIRDLSTALLVRYLPAADEKMAPMEALADAAERAPSYAGHYRLAGTPQHDFFKLGALLDNVDVEDNGDGTITIGSTRYGEVEPLLFQSKTDPGFFVVFAENGEGEVELLTFGGTNSYQKVRWYESPPFQIGLMATMLLAFLSFIVVMPFSRHRHWPVWTMSLLNIIFLGALGTMMMTADLILFFKTIPATTQLLFLLPWLSGALLLAMPIFLRALWRKRASAWVRLHYLLTTMASVAFLWFVVYWNLYLT